MRTTATGEIWIQLPSPGMKPNAGIKPKNGSSPRLTNPKTTRSTIYSPRSSGFLILSPASYPSGRDIRSALPSAADSQGSGEGRLGESMRIELFLNGDRLLLHYATRENYNQDLQLLQRGPEKRQQMRSSHSSTFHHGRP
jgi:hypothetical protein